MNIGHNSAAEIQERIDNVLGQAARLPAVIQDDETNAKAGDFVKILTTLINDAEAVRKAEKEPHLQAGKAVDAKWAEAVTPLEEIKKSLRSKQTAYMLAEEARKRAEAKAEADRLAAEAKTDADIETAIAVEAVATTAKSTDLTRVTSTYGTTTTLATKWTFKDIDRTSLDINALSPYFTPDAIEKALRAAIKAGVRTIKGVTIYEEKSAR